MVTYVLYTFYQFYISDIRENAYPLGVASKNITDIFRVN